MKGDVCDDKRHTCGLMAGIRPPNFISGSTFRTVVGMLIISRAKPYQESVA
jgi:hypothetical protein